ncbi:MAG: thiamine phosphate synthase [Phycisphaeraceae bacterium]|nr:thiamine phosphate synthase [Phycisphaeraceae bacterium]
MHSAARILDANLNRAREALRVLEDIARFALDDRELSGELKSMRHALRDAAALLGIDDLELIAARDAVHDVGKDIKTQAEGERESLRSVASAAGKRLTEALRSIEEIAKALPGAIRAPARGGMNDAEPRAAAQPDEPAWRAFERLRYRAYDAEMRTVLALGSPRRATWKLCVIVTKDLCRHHSWLDVANEAIEAGADCIQLREKDISDAELLARARVLVELCHTGGSRVAAVINDRPDIALLAGADGVHLGQEDMSVADVRRLSGARLLVGVSTANILHATRALREGADYCGVGPMFPSTTKHKDTIAGLEYLKKYLEYEPRLPPHLAIGGIAPGNIDLVAKTGATGVAVSSAVCESMHPGDVVRRLLGAMTRTRDAGPGASPIEG